MVAPAVVHESERTPETSTSDRLDGSWKTLISAGLTPTEALTLGIARLGPGEALSPHRHSQPEVYLILGGAGRVTIEGDTSAVEAGTAVFIPGNALHSLAATGEGVRLAYAFAADSMDHIRYEFVDVAD